jgi:predicted dehydrogenase
MINVGIIGFGKMGSIRAEAIKADGNGKVVAVHDTNEFTDCREYKRVGDKEAIIDNPNIDAVFICTPNYLNKSLTMSCLKAKKHVFCEKPPAFTCSDVEEIRRDEVSSGMKLMYGFNHRYHTSIKYMKGLIDSEKYGRVLWLRGRYGKSVDKNFYSNWRAKKELAGGGILIDQGIHMLDLFFYLGGCFDEVEAYISNLYWKLDVEDNVFAMLRNSKTGTVASLHSTMTQWRHLFSLEVFLEKGYMVLNGLKTSSGTYGDEVLMIAKNRSSAPAATWEDEERITFEKDVSWRSEIDHFFSAIKDNKPIENGNSTDALILMQLVDKIYEKKHV